MFADSTADTSFYINIGPLQPDLDSDLSRSLFPDSRCPVQLQIIPAIGRDPVLFAIEQAEVITAAIPARYKFSAAYTDPCCRNLLHLQRAVPECNKDRPGMNGLGTQRTVFLTDNTGFIHGPGQTAATLDKGSADLDRSLVGKFLFSEFFVQAQRPDGCSGTDLTAGSTVELAATGADPVVQYR